MNINNEIKKINHKYKIESCKFIDTKVNPVFLNYYQVLVKNKHHKLALAIALFCKDKELSVGLQNAIRVNHNVIIPADKIPANIKRKLIKANKSIIDRQKRWNKFFTKYHQFYFKLTKKHINDIPTALSLISQTQDEMVLKTMLHYLATNSLQAKNYYIKK